MKVLILGAKGNLGQQLVEVFKKNPSTGSTSSRQAGSGRGNEIIAWDREEIDITDKALISKKIKELKPKLIINAAAYNAVDKCEEPDGYEIAKKINAAAPGYLAQAALASKATLVHFSTDYVFDGKKRAGYKEDNQPKPTNKYGETKRAGEEEIIRLSGRGLKWYLIRTSKLFGPKGESVVAKPSFFDIMLKLAKEKEQLELVDEELSCFTYTKDLAAAVRKLVDGDSGYGIYHLVNPGAVTWYQAALELFRQAGVKVRVIPVKSDKFPRPAKRPKYSVLLNTKFEPLRDWREALRDYLHNGRNL